MIKEGSILMSRFIRDSDLRWIKRNIPVLVSILIFFLSPPLRGNNETSALAPLISRIRITVDGEPGEAEMKKLIPMKEGDAFSLKRVTESIKQIYKSGLFSDIQVEKEGEQQVMLDFLLTKKLYVRKVTLSGSDKIPQKKLKEGLYSLREGSTFSEDNLDRAVKELEDVLKREGFYQIEVEAIPTRDALSARVDVVFFVHSAKNFVVNKIDFTGQILLSQEELKKKMRTEVGKDYIPDLLEDDFRRLRESYQSRDYRRAEVKLKNAEFDRTQGNVSLTIEMVPHERIEIIVRGAKIPLRLLKPIWEERIFEEWGLSEGEAKIINHMRKKEYLFSTVNSFVEREENKIRIVHEVSPGDKYKIQEMTFDGLSYFKPAQIKERLLLGETIPLFSRPNGARLFEIPQEIEYLYMTYGFPSTLVTLNFEKRGNKIRPIFSIEEGKQEIIESLSVEGAQMFSQEELLKQIGSAQGGAFFRPSIQKDIGKLEEFYLNQGIRGTQISAEIRALGDRNYAVDFMIKEGMKVWIENVIIVGNEVTQKKTVLREVQLKSGDAAHLDKIRDTKTRLERLGIFTVVKIEELHVSPEKENLVISVREGDRNYAGLGVGLETLSETRSLGIWNYEMRPRGTAEFIRSNIFGTASQVSLVVQVSSRERRMVFSGEQPYFFGLPVKSYLNAWLEREARKSFTYERRGLSLTGIRSLSQRKDMIFLTTLRMARTTLVELRVSESEVDRRFFPFSTTSISGSYIWENRDDPFNPKNGHFFSSVVEWAYPLFRTESDFLKTYFQFQHFVPLFPDITFSATTRLGLGRGEMPIHERFFAGGSNSFRGVGFDELGPKDPDSLKPTGGKTLLLFNFELTFPLFSSLKNLSGAVFYDFGNVFDQSRQISWDSMRNAVGLGLRYRTPLGPIRLELGWNMDPVEGEKEVLGFITIGHVF